MCIHVITHKTRNEMHYLGKNFQGNRTANSTMKICVIRKSNYICSVNKKWLV